jgi:hypothetical protein
MMNGMKLLILLGLGSDFWFFRSFQQIKNIAGKVVDATYDLAEALSLISMVRLRYGFI